MQKRTKVERGALVKQWKESGKSMAMWCKENRISKTTFFYWVQREKPKITNAPLARSDFAELKNPIAEPALEIRCRGVHICLSNNFDPQALQKCLKVLRNFAC